MNCRKCLRLLDDSLASGPDSGDQAELVKHLEDCPRCARQRALADEALAAMERFRHFRASPDLRERIMSAITDLSAAEAKPVVAGPVRVRLWKAAMVVAAAAVLLIGTSILLNYPRGGNGPEGVSAFSLLARASAAEKTLFGGDGVVQLVNEIVVKPVSDAAWARTRWLPLMSLEATGKPRFHQLTLPAEVGKGYTVKDQCWYDPATGRFVRLLTAAGSPIFANSYDGTAVFSLETTADGARRVARHPVAEGFQPPKNPAGLLGIAAGLQHGLDEKDSSAFQDAGEVTLADGSKARVVKAGFPAGGPEGSSGVYWLFTIRRDDNTIAKMEFLAGKQSLLMVRRVKTGTVRSPAVAWDLAGIDQQAGDTQQKPQAGIIGNMVIPNVSVEHMLKKAGFTTYVFQKAPPWAGQREITDVLDIVSPPHRMFAITYRAKDGRHVVLVQSHSYNKMLGPMIGKLAKVVYASPGGVKVYSGPQDKWLAGILLQSARAAIKDPPSKDRTGYLLETPAGTFPALAVNGRLSEEELHALIDSLVPAKNAK